MIMEKEVFLRRLEKVYDRMKSLGTRLYAHHAGAGYEVSDRVFHGGG